MTTSLHFEAIAAHPSEQAISSERLWMAEEKKSLWALSADPAARAKAYKQQQSREATKEMRTMNVKHETLAGKVSKKLKGGK